MKRFTRLQSFVIVLLAGSGITGLELYALYLGHNGTMFALSIGALAGLAGYHLKGVQK